MNKSMNLLEWLFNLGTKSAMPRYVTFLCLIQSGVLLVPESGWTSLRLNSLQYLENFPVFVQYYVNNSDFKNAMFVFWLISPFTLLINTVIWLLHINIQDYPTYLQRRTIRLEQQGKSSDYSVIVGILAFLMLYVWGSGIYLDEPKILGNFVPAKSQLAMLIVHAGSIGILIPISITMLVTELRANISESTFFTN